VRSIPITTIYDPPAGFEHNAPYMVALVKLEEGPMVTAQLTDVDFTDVRSACRWRWSRASCAPTAKKG
jgi:uncharacterized OB-fold protein